MAEPAPERPGPRQPAATLTASDAMPSAENPEADAFVRLIAAAARDGRAHAVFVEILRSCRVTTEERRRILVRFESGSD
jgi:hypothetical protein